MPTITAGDIDKWAQEIGAPPELPRLVRRLIMRAPGITSAVVPAGTSSRRPGWDGSIDCNGGNAWVPNGRSYWEMTCRADTGTKAASDYEKRVNETPPDERARSTFIFVSARNWPGKSTWVAAARAKGEWADVRVYDADDLEQWLEYEPIVSLAFAEELGRRGPGVESPRSYWNGWAAKPRETLKPESIFLGRDQTRTALTEKLRAHLEQPRDGRFVIHADSIEEATAFAAVCTLEDEALTAHSIVVTSEEGWRFVQLDARIAVAFAATEQAARVAPTRAGLLTVIPLATGDADRIDMEGVANTDRDAFVLRRQDAQHFELAVARLGIDANEAHRLSRSTGRSWSVYLRHRSLVPEIQQPSWLQNQDAQILLTMCLVGGWNAEQKADRDVVESVAGIPYAEIELTLARLAKANDAPVLRIGQVWKAKSPVELLSICAPLLSSDIVDKFFEVLCSILSEIDPELDLPAEERWRAGVLGKRRPESGLLIASMLDSVTKLAVRGDELSGLHHLRFADRSEALVRGLLLDAPELRWLSIAGHLPALAEAAPRAFFAALERVLAQPNNPVRALFQESEKASGLTGRSYHVGLLWSLELLAWAPQFLPRVADILSILCAYDDGSRGNSAIGSLNDILRSWMPQTAATLAQRKAIMEKLALTYPDAAFELFLRMTPHDSTGNFTARPQWRQDDAGAEGGITNEEVQECQLIAIDQAIGLAAGHARRTARVLSLLWYVDKQREDGILGHCRGFLPPAHDDAAREIVRDALRRQVYQRRSYKAEEIAQNWETLEACDQLFAELAPGDLPLRHRWLFADGAPELLAGFLENHFERGGAIDQSRNSALREIFSEGGLTGVSRLAELAIAPGLVGYQSATIGPIANVAGAWIVERFAESQDIAWFRAFSGGFVGGLAEGEFAKVSRNIEAAIKRQSWSLETIANFLTLFPSRPPIWEMAKTLGVHEMYWQRVRPGLWVHAHETFHEQEVDHLLEARRPRSAFAVVHMSVNRAQPQQVAAILEALVRGEEPDGGLLRPWDLNEAIKVVEESNCLDQKRLISLEFALLPSHGEGVQVRALIHAITTDPALFVEILSLMRRRKDEDPETPVDEGRRAVAARAWQLVHGTTRVPGTQTDGTIVEAELTSFVDECRRLAAEKDILAPCEAALGEIIAHVPTGADGVWPSEAARTLVDRPSLDSLRNGFCTGAINKRGMTSRPVFDGGNIERGLANVYRDHSAKLAAQYPRLADALNNVVKHYENWAKHHDDAARLRREGH